MEPISFADNLVKGVILAAYDFVRLTCAGFVVPMISKKRSFWASTISIEARLSSLTHLVLWVLLTVSIGSRTGAEVASSVTGLAKSPGRDIPTTIVLALLVSMLVDVMIRLGLLAFHSHVRRRLYGQLARVAAANIFFGACAIMCVMLLVDSRDWLAHAIPISYLGSRIPFLPNPLIFLFSISLGVIAVKAFAIKRPVRRWLMGTAIAFAAPVLLVNISLPMYQLVKFSLEAISPVELESVEIFPAFPKCEFSSEKIRVSTDLMLKGADTFLVQSYYFAIYQNDDADGSGERYIGRPVDDQSAVILVKDKYVHFETSADFNPTEAAAQRPVGRFFCSLKLITGWTSGALGSLPHVDPP